MVRPGTRAPTLDQFFSRSPTSEVPYKSWIGLEDMIPGDTDFVFRKVTKRLAMEFDWKRKPVNAREVEVELKGKTYRHLTFDTKPVSTVAEFNAGREAWENYNKSPPRNLKTLKNLEGFQLFLVTSVDTVKKKNRYLSKTDGNIKRLRLALTRALKKQQVGFDLVAERTRVTNNDFCEALNACSIPCRVTDVENGKKAE